MRTNALISLFILIIWIVSGCTSKTEQNIIRLSVLRGPTAIIFSNWFEDAPVIDNKKVEISIIDSPELMQALLIRKETDFAVLPMINAANLYNKGIEYQVAGCPVWGNLYLVERNEVPKEDTDLYIFGAGTTPDILTRFYCEKNDLSFSYNYSFQTASEIVQAIYAQKVNRAVIAEPYLSMVLQKDSSIHIIADLNSPEQNKNFAQTAVVYHKDLKKYKQQLDSLLIASCQLVNHQPEQTIRQIEQLDIFPTGALTRESIGRCKINYKSVEDAKKEIESFLMLIFQYEPKATGGKLPDTDFYQ